MFEAGKAPLIDKLVGSNRVDVKNYQLFNVSVVFVLFL